MPNRPGTSLIQVNSPEEVMPHFAAPIPANPTTARARACLVCPVRARTICAPIAPAAIDLVARLRLPPRRIAAGAAIYAEQADCAEYFTLLEGWAALTAGVEDGARLVLDFALPGDFIGFQANPAAPRPQSAIAVTDVRLCPLPRGAVETLLGAAPAVAAHLSHLIAVHEARAHDHLVNSNGRSARERLAHLFIELYFRQRHTLPRLAGETIDLPLTLGLIGDAVGLTGVHISRTLRRLREEGVVQLRHRRLTVIDPDRLIAASGVESRPLAYEAAEPAGGRAT